MSALPDRAPPELEPGATIDSLVTVEACDLAYDRLMMAIGSIERQLSGRPSVNEPADWRPRAKMVLRVKKMLLPRLQQRRAVIVRMDKDDRPKTATEEARAVAQDKRKVFLGIAWDTEPDAMRRVEVLARERRPDLFDRTEVAR